MLTTKRKRAGCELVLLCAVCGSRTIYKCGCRVYLLRYLAGPELISTFAATLFMYNNLAQIHIGQLIDTRIKACGLSYAEFARRLHVERTTVYNIIRSKSIDIDRLIRISDILDYDFLRVVYLKESPKHQVHIDISSALLNEFVEDGQIVVNVRLDDSKTRK